MCLHEYVCACVCVCVCMHDVCVCDSVVRASDYFVHTYTIVHVHVYPDASV